MIEKVLKTESEDVHYWISDTIKKETITLFFLHGLTANHELFTTQVDYFGKDYNELLQLEKAAMGK